MSVFNILLFWVSFPSKCPSFRGGVYEMLQILSQHCVSCSQSPIMTIDYYLFSILTASNFSFPYLGVCISIFMGAGGLSAKGAGTREDGDQHFGRRRWRFNGLVEYGVLFILKTLDPANHPPVLPGRTLPVEDSHVFRILAGRVERAWFPAPAAGGWHRRRRWDRPGAGPRSGSSGPAPGCRPAAR